MSKTLPESLIATCDRLRLQPAVTFKKETEWVTWNWGEYLDKIQCFALALKGYGVKAKTQVAIFSSTRVEWAIADFAILGLGGVVVPVYPNVTIEDLSSILLDSDPEVLIVENSSLLRQILLIKDRLKNLKHLILIEGDSKAVEVLQFWSLLDSKAGVLFEKKDGLRKEFLAQDPNSIATRVFTSGTTGNPRSISLLHSQIFFEVATAFRALGIVSSDKSLSFLPYAHILGRIESWGHAVIGFELAFAQSMERIRSDLLEIKPTILVAVPRIFEKVAVAIQTQLQANPWFNTLSTWGLQESEKILEEQVQNRPLSWKLFFEKQVLDQSLSRVVRSVFGGRLRFAISGGANLDEKIEKFFAANGVPVLQGYGMTETCGAICVNLPFDHRIGTVGKPLPGVELKIAADNEVLLKAPQIVKSELSSGATFIDGWLHTGDLGLVLPSGHLQITGRKKELIKTDGGKYVSPQKIESLLADEPLIGNAMVYGDGRKFVIALVALNQKEAFKWAEKNNLATTDLAQLSQALEMQNEIKAAIRKANLKLASYESIKKFLILPEEPTVESGELTPSLKLKKKVIEQKYLREINSLYRGL